ENRLHPFFPDLQGSEEPWRLGTLRPATIRETESAGRKPTSGKDQALCKQRGSEGGDDATRQNRGPLPEADRRKRRERSAVLNKCNLLRSARTLVQYAEAAVSQRQLSTTAGIGACSFCLQGLLFLPRITIFQ